MVSGTFYTYSKINLNKLYLFIGALSNMMIIYYNIVQYSGPEKEKSCFICACVLSVN